MTRLEGMPAFSDFCPPTWPETIGREAYPSAEIDSLDCMPDGTWVAEVRFDNLLFEGIGTSEASALAAAILEISDCLRPEFAARG